MYAVAVELRVGQWLIEVIVNMTRIGVMMTIDEKIKVVAVHLIGVSVRLIGLLTAGVGENWYQVEEWIIFWRW